MAMTEVSVYGFTRECQQGRCPDGNLLHRPPNQDEELDEIFHYIIILELEHSLGEVS